MSRKKIVNSGVVIPWKKGMCEDCLQSAVGTCQICEKRIDQHKEVEPNLSKLKRKQPKEKITR